MHPAELIHLSDEQLASADTDGDGKVDIADATRLQKYLAEFEGIVLGKQQNVAEVFIEQTIDMLDGRMRISLNHHL